MRGGRGCACARANDARITREKLCAARIYNAIKRSPQNENFPLEIHSASSEKLANNKNKINVCNESYFIEFKTSKVLI